MERCIAKDERYKKVLNVVRVLYILAGLGLMVHGIVRKSSYEALLAPSTLLLIPLIYLFRRIFHWKGGWQLETYIYVFSLLGWTLGGAGELYGLLPGYDKVVHCISGVFVSVIALAMYEYLERNHSPEDRNPATGMFFVFFTSMGVAGLFELCEYTLAPIMHRDLQHVADTGVGDTMQDMIVALLGTLVVIFLMLRRQRGKRDGITDGARAFALQNSDKEK